MRRLRNIDIDTELIEAPCSEGAKWRYVTLCRGELPEDQSLDATLLHVAKTLRLPVNHIMSHLIELIDAGLIRRVGDIFLLPDMPGNERSTTSLT